MKTERELLTAELEKAHARERDLKQQLRGLGVDIAAAQRRTTQVEAALEALPQEIILHYSSGPGNIVGRSRYWCEIKGGARLPDGVRFA